MGGGEREECMREREGVYERGVYERERVCMRERGCV
jgi:hypothetical protein